MSLLFKKVNVASIEEFNNFCNNFPNVKYIDAIVSDTAGIVRGKRFPVNEIKKLFISGIQFASAIFLLDVTGNSSDPGGRGFSDGDPQILDTVEVLASASPKYSIKVEVLVTLPGRECI